MRRLSLIFPLLLLSQLVWAKTQPMHADTDTSADWTMLMQFLLGDAKDTSGAEDQRQLLEQKLALQDRILAEAKRVGVSEHPDVKVKIELARRRILVEAYWEQWFHQHPITEQQIKALYAEIRKFNDGRQYRLSQIVVKADAAARKALDSLERKKDFADVAKELSEDNATKSQGGDLGWLWKSDLVPSMARALDFLKPGQFTSTPIAVSDKLLIVRLDETRKQDYPTLDEIRIKLGNILRLRAQQQELARLREAMH